MDLYTIGFEGIRVPEFLEILKKNQVESLVDIRGNPNSRKPGFSKNALATALNEQGIEYVPFYTLGVPKEIRKAYHQDNDVGAFTQKILDFLEQRPDEIVRLAEVVGQKKCCLLCYEADYSRCHRVHVAAAVQKISNKPLTIIHLAK